MELVNTNNVENPFDPTPKLKSSPIPILFVPFNHWDKNCFYCGDKYTETLFYRQPYCKKCLSQYITDITDNNTYLDMSIYTMNLECNEHEMSRNKGSLIQNIQEWCENCSGISYFKQLYTVYSNYNYLNILKNSSGKIFKSEKGCKLCGKLVYQNSNYDQGFKVCSNCYLISSGWIESSLTKQPIPILYLPWWDNRSLCIACGSGLNFTSDCQKYCSHCYIFYTGCRYCLTTNIIFGFTDQTQCKKCERISFIATDTSTSNDLNSLNDFLHDLTINPYNLNYLQLAKAIDDVKRTDNLMNIYEFIKHHTKYPALFGSNPLPILFIPFNNQDLNCFYCKDKYVKIEYRDYTKHYKKYCKKCLSSYIITNNSNGLESSKHETDRNEYSNCCLISGYVESTLTKKPILVLYLSWWDNNGFCIACESELKFTSDCQKHCARCCLIYIGCRYCLTTNIIFGFADQTQCKKCKRIFITFDITNVSSEDGDLDDFLYNPDFYSNLQLD